MVKNYGPNIWENLIFCHNFQKENKCSYSYEQFFFFCFFKESCRSSKYMIGLSHLLLWEERNSEEVGKVKCRLQAFTKWIKGFKAAK